MTIEALVKVVPPPAMLQAGFDGLWDLIEAELGVVFPQDYKDFVRVYGYADYGDYLCWVTRGDPADWRVVVWGRGDWTFEELDCDLTDFLAGLATGDVLPKEFPDELLPCGHPYVPASV